MRKYKKLEGDIYHTYAVRAEAFFNLGYADEINFAEALNELGELSKVEELGVRMLILKCRILIAANEPEQAAEIARGLIEERRVFVAYVYLLEANVKMRDAGGVIDAYHGCAYYYPDYARSYEEAIRVFMAFEEDEEVRKVLEHAKSNGVNSPFLEAYEYKLKYETPKTPTFDERFDVIKEMYVDKFYQTHNMKYYEEGYTKLNELFYDYPSEYMLVERALFNMNAMKYDDALRDFYKVLEYCPDYEYAYTNLGYIYKNMCDYEKAMMNLRKAIYYQNEKKTPYPYRNLARVFERIGDHDEAIKVYETLAETVEGQEKFHITVNDIIRSTTKAGHGDKAFDMVENNRNNRNWVDNDIEYYNERFDICIENEDLDGAERELGAMENAYNTLYGELSGNDISKWHWNIMYNDSRLLLLTGKIYDALAILKQMFNTKGIREGLGEYTVCEAYLTALSIVKVRNNGLLGWKDEAEKCAKRLLECISESIDTNVDDNDTFFEGRKHQYWYEFLATYFLGDVEELEAVYNKMEACRMCNFCVRCVCTEQNTARAMLMEKRGDLAEAIKIHKENYKAFPYDVDAREKILYLDK